MNIEQLLATLTIDNTNAVDIANIWNEVTLKTKLIKDVYLTPNNIPATTDNISAIAKCLDEILYEQFLIDQFTYADEAADSDCAYYATK
jgi:hypothetical protein